MLMQGAAEHDRLASNTYRRLNLGLTAWAAANLTLLARELQHMLSHGAPGRYQTESLIASCLLHPGNLQQAPLGI